MAVNDAWRLLPFADVLYACDAAWWDHHSGANGFAGERWSSHGDKLHNNKLACADRWRLSLVAGADREGFSLNPAHIHYGSNSGFQAINLAILFGATEIALVGFDMHANGGQTHFFGAHPKPLRDDKNYGRFIPALETAAKMLPDTIRITNCTPGSALGCFPKASLDDVLTDWN